MDGHLEDATFPFDGALCFAGRDFRAHTHGCVKGAETRGSRTHSFAENSLRDKVESYFFLSKLFQKVVRVRTREGCNHVPDLAVLEQQSQFAIACSAIVADGGDISRAFLGKRLDQVVGESCAAESAKHDSSAVWDIGHGRIQARIDFFPHGPPYPTRGGATPPDGLRPTIRARPMQAASFPLPASILLL